MARFLYIAKGSCRELRSQIYLMSALDLISDDEQSDLYNKCIEISKMLAGFIKYLQNFETKTS
jgi:four helix bundle protein